MGRKSKNAELNAVIMCGGSGTRFWPASRRKTPKQFLRLFTNRSLIQETVTRLKGLIPAEQIFLLAGEEHQDMLKRHLPDIPPECYILEPLPRNTAPALALAARVLELRSPSAVIAALPADHHIADTGAFHKALKTAAEAVRNPGAIATIGIKPEFPETGYGYIEIGKEKRGGVHDVVKFVEKPDHKLAQEYLDGGKHLWNAGMFIMRADTLAARFEEYQPRIWNSLWKEIPAPGQAGFESRLKEVYPKLESISIDYAIMEKARGVVCVPADIGWSDLGSWNALEQLWPGDEAGNSASGRYYSVDSHGNIVSRGSREIALIGVNDLVIVERNDVVLVCARDRCQELRELISQLEQDGRDDLL